MIAQPRLLNQRFKLGNNSRVKVVRLHADGAELDDAHTD
jgi:hypothetical protein